MQRYEISAKRSKVYTWEEAKALLLKGKVMAGEWVDNGPVCFYKIERGRLYYTNDFEYEWIPEPEKVRTFRKFQWYRARAC